MKRKSTITVIATAISLSMAGTSFAGEWQWIDNNGDGTAECYYIENGTALTSSTTPDGYQVDGTGAWIVDGIVQTQKTSQAADGVNHSANYDPAHPLANAPESWDLKLTPDKNFLNYHYICGNDNIHAMLTDQMEYYHVRTGYDSDRQNAEEQALYQWFCNWLNGMDFEHMSEMDRAKEIQTVLSTKRYEYTAGGNAIYHVLIEGKGVCGDFAMTARALARAVGLKSAVTQIGTSHAGYFVQVDGITYAGENQLLQLNYSYDDYEHSGLGIDTVTFID